MSHFKVEKVTNGLIWVEIEEADLRLCCGCPPDATKFLKKRKLLSSTSEEGRGPNALLVSDDKVHRGRMVSFAEFPVMQMLYIQGMIANAGKVEGLPLIIGLKENVNVQMAYMCRGNYGYYSKSELRESGCSAEEADIFYKTKLWFADGRIYRPKELCRTLYLDYNAHEVKNGVYIQRIGYNFFKIIYKDERIEIDLNESESEHPLPFPIKDSEFELTDFSVLHSGEGNGWEPENPCMGSLIINNGKIYAVDTGPGFSDIINYLGLDVQDLEGVFLTHVHDDHFAGLPDLLKSSGRLKFYSTALVRHTAQKKLAALLDLEAEMFHHFFEVVDLKSNLWNVIDGLEVLPFFSPHPVETNAFLFRKKSREGFKSYAHIADTISFKNLEKIVTITGGDFFGLKNKFKEYVDVKKVDIGGGFIHGEKEDYQSDRSKKIVLSHTKNPSYVMNGKEYLGSQFGKQDVLIEGERSLYEKKIFCEILQKNFPDLDERECLFLFENGNRMRMRRDEILNLSDEMLFSVLNGSISYSDVSFHQRIVFDRDHIVGLNEFFDHTSSSYVVNSSFISAVGFPRSEFMEIVKNKASWRLYKRNDEVIRQLSRSCIFGEFSCSHLVFNLSEKAEYFQVKAGSILEPEDLSDLYVMVKGVAFYQSFERKLKINSGDFFGGNFIFVNDYGKYDVVFPDDSLLIKIPGSSFENIPLVLWKIYENCTTFNHMCKTQ